MYFYPLIKFISVILLIENYFGDKISIMAIIEFFSFFFGNLILNISLID